MSLSAQTLAALGRAKLSLGDLVITVTVKTRTQIGFNNVTGKPDITESTKYLKCVYDQFRQDEIDGENIRADDLKLVDFSVSVALDLSDIIEIDTRTYKLIRITPIMVGNHVGVRLLQLRR